MRGRSSAFHRWIGFGVLWIIACIPISGYASAKGLVWDAIEKIHEAKPGDSSATVTFKARNSGSREIIVDRVEKSCGCTSIVLPASPWRLPPGADGELKLAIDLVGKSGEIRKTATVFSNEGKQTLTVVLKIPPIPEAIRQANRAMAKKDRQAVFRGDCARCHSTPTIDKEGAELFSTACAVCHDSPNRATSVPELTAALFATRSDAELRELILKGKPDGLMPAFGRDQGGPLIPDQVDSLVAFLRAIYRNPKP